MTFDCDYYFTACFSSSFRPSVLRAEPIRAGGRFARCATSILLRSGKVFLVILYTRGSLRIRDQCSALTKNLPQMRLQLRSRTRRSFFVKRRNLLVGSISGVFDALSRASSLCKLEVLAHYCCFAPFASELVIVLLKQTENKDRPHLFNCFTCRTRETVKTRRNESKLLKTKNKLYKEKLRGDFK